MRRVIAGLVGLAVAVGLFAGAVVRADAEARKGPPSAQIKHRENDASYFNVRCQHNGFQEWITLWSGGVSGCGKYFFMVEVPPGRELWCRTLGTQNPDVPTFGAGLTTWTSPRSLNCRVIWYT